MGFFSGNVRTLKVCLTENMRKYLIGEDKSGLIVKKFSFGDPDVNYLIAKGGIPPDITKNPVVDGITGNILSEGNIPDITGIDGPSLSGTPLSAISCTNTTLVKEQTSLIRVKKSIVLSESHIFEFGKCGVHFQGFDMTSVPISIKYSAKGGVIYQTMGTEGDGLGSGNYNNIENLNSIINTLMSIVIDIDTTLVVYDEKNFQGNVIFGPVTGPLFLVYTEGQTSINNSIVLNRKGRLDSIDQDIRVKVTGTFSKYKRVFYLNGNRVTSNVNTLAGNNISQPVSVCGGNTRSGLESWCSGSLKIFYTPGEVPPHSKIVCSTCWDGNPIDEITQFSGVDPSTL